MIGAFEIFIGQTSIPLVHTAISMPKTATRLIDLKRRDSQFCQENAGCSARSEGRFWTMVMAAKSHPLSRVIVGENPQRNASISLQMGYLRYQDWGMNFALTKW